MGSFTCDTSNCHEGYSNWQQGKGKEKKEQGIHCQPGCMEILHGNRAYKFTGTNVKELALNVGKVNVDKSDFFC